MVLLAELVLLVCPVVTILTLLCIDSSDEYSDSLNSEPSGMATFGQHPNKKVGKCIKFKKIFYCFVIVLATPLFKVESNYDPEPRACLHCFFIVLKTA